MARRMDIPQGSARCKDHASKSTRAVLPHMGYFDGGDEFEHHGKLRVPRIKLANFVPRFSHHGAATGLGGRRRFSKAPPCRYHDITKFG
jgi:hypothetical protein